jgi:SsrA-binding protein
MDFKELENRKAKFNYHLLQTFTAGIKLYGSEIKAIREGKANIKEAYCLFVRDELFAADDN